MSKLYVVTPVFNPSGYEAIYRNYRRFAAHMFSNTAVVLITVECALSDRPFVVTETGSPHHVQVRSKSVLWIKENLENLGIQRVVQLYPNTNEIAWIDADVDFLDPEWADKTVLALDHFDVVQPWSEAIYAGPHEEFRGHVRSFMNHYSSGEAWTGHPPAYGSLWHPGFAWAARRSAVDGLGGLLDISIVGAGDLQMSLSLIGLADETLKHEGIDDGRMPRYADAIHQWQDRADFHVRRNVGVVKGMIRHHFHGRQVDRRYDERYAVPRAHSYDPTRHILRNAHGVYEVSHHSIGLRDDLRRYFAQRNDDANTID